MIFKHLLGVAPLQIAQALIGFCAIAAFTRLMSPEEFGRYALALSASMLAHTLVFTWAEAAAYRFFAASKAEGRLQDHFATLLALAAALGAAAMLATGAILLILGLHNDMAALCAFAGGAAVFRFLTRIVRETERAALSVQRYAAAETAYLAIGFAAGIAFLTLFDLGPAAPFAGLMLAGALILSIDAPRLMTRARGGAVSMQRAQTYASYGAPLALALAVDLGVQTLVRVILAQQSDLASVGAYAVAWGLARPLDIIFLWAGAVLMPALMAAHDEHGAEAARVKAREIFVMIAAVAIPAAIGLALVAQPLATLLVGEGLSAGAASALPWLAAAGLCSGFNLYYWSEAFQLRRRTGLRALVMLAPGALQIALTFWLAPLYGAMGAAIAAAGAALFGGVVLGLVGRRLLALPLPIAALARIALASAAMTGAVLALPPLDGVVGMALKAGVGAMVYAIGAIALDIAGVRARASALPQALSAKLRILIHALFTDRANARAN